MHGRPRAVLAASLAFFVVSLGSEARLSWGPSVLLSELVVLICLSLTTLAAATQRHASPISSKLLAIFVFTAAISLAFSDDLQVSITAIRNIIFTFLAMFVTERSELSANHHIRLIKLFSTCATVLAGVGVAQAIYGYESTFTIYDLGLASEPQGVVLLEVLSWKLTGIQDAGFMAWQRSLAVGLHVYSNNFAEYLVYGAIAAFASYRAGCTRALTYRGSTVLIALAIVLSGSRTALLGFSVALLHHVHAVRGSAYLRWAVVSLASGLLLTVWGYSALVGILGYDKFGTISGRLLLDFAAMKAILSSPVSVVFGGTVASYYRFLEQSPHNIFIYLTLLFGLATSIPFCAGVFMIALRLHRAHAKPTTPETKAALSAALMATLWFLLYGQTWSIVENAASGMLWALFAGSGLCVTAAMRIENEPASPATG